MRKLKTISGITAAILALALGGSAVATAAHHHAKKRPAVEATTPDTDNIQSGDQTSPDRKAAKASSESSEGEATESDGPGGHEDPVGDVENEETV
jgi:hypothetical protein